MIWWYIYQTILCYFCCYVYFILLSYINPCTIHSFDIVIQHHALYCIVLLYTHITYHIYIYTQSYWCHYHYEYDWSTPMITQSKVWIHFSDSIYLWCHRRYDAYCVRVQYFIPVIHIVLKDSREYHNHKETPQSFLPIYSIICRILEL